MLRLAAVAVAAAAASEAAAEIVPSTSRDPLAADEGCSHGAASGVQLLQHRVAAHQVVKPRPQANWTCPPYLCTTTTTTPRALAVELVHEVYTYGAPATHGKHPFVNAARGDGCFGGLRSYNEDLLGAFSEIHQVDAASMNNYYPHATTNSVVLHWNRDSYYTPCVADIDRRYGHPAWPQRGGQVYEEWRLHQEDDYTDRLDQVTVDGKKVVDSEPFKTARSFVILAFKTYDTTNNTKAAIAERLPGWRLVERLVDVVGTDKDPVLLIQQHKTLACAVAFTGTNDLGEFATSTTQYGTGYCGFNNVHVGYRNELWTITNDIFARLRPSLERCSRVTCVGHSLGGALCELFAACANSGNYTDPDYKLLAWTPGTPKMMSEYEPSKGEE